MNSHDCCHTPLKRACLPIPALSHSIFDCSVIIITLRAFVKCFISFWPDGKSQAKNAVLFQQTILRYFVHFGQHEKATRQSPAGSLCFIVLFLCYFRVLCVRFSLKYERTGAARPPPPSTRPAPCSHSARLKPSLGSCSSRFGFARSPPVIPRRASSLSGATAE